MRRWAIVWTEPVDPWGPIYHIPPEALTENQRRAIEHIIDHRGQEPAPPSGFNRQSQGTSKVVEELSAKEVSREIARTSGFAGIACSQCGSFNTKNNGTCLVCTECFATTGCS